MLDYEQQQKLIVVFVLAVILVAIISILAIVFIWIPDKEVEPSNEFVVGKINEEDVLSNDEDMVKKYYNQLYALFINDDMDELYNIVAKDYLEYNKLDKESLYKMLKNKMILSKPLELVQYKTYWIDGYTNVYELDLKVPNEAYSLSVVLREKTPNNYDIAFDKFIDYKKDAYDLVVESVALRVKEQIRYTNSVQYEFNLRNNYADTIKINTGSSAAPIILVNSQEEVKRPIMTTLSTAEIRLEPKASRDFVAVFGIEDVYDYMSYRTLVIKKVQFEGVSGANNIEYKL